VQVRIEGAISGQGQGWRGGNSWPAQSDRASGRASPEWRHASSQGLGAVPRPQQIEADSRDPKRAIQELRGLFNTLFKLTVAKIYHSPRTTAGAAILRSNVSAASVFDCALKGLYLLLRGQLPRQFWQVFGISLLAYACGLANQDQDLSTQSEAIFADLLQWAQAISDGGDQQGYVLLVQQLWSPNENLFQPVAARPWSHMNDPLESMDMTRASLSLANAMSPLNDSWLMGGGGMAQTDNLQLRMLQKEFDNQHLLNTLSNGAAAQLCKQFLDRELARRWNIVLLANFVDRLRVSLFRP
jgi:hypothetical protein